MNSIFNKSKNIKGDNLMDIFSFDGSLADINEVKKNGWEIELIEKNFSVGDLGIVVDN